MPLIIVFALSTADSCVAAQGNIQPAPTNAATTLVVHVTDAREYQYGGRTLSPVAMCRFLDRDLAQTHAREILVQGSGDALTVADVLAFTGLMQKYGVAVRVGEKSMNFDGVANPSADACAISDPPSGE